jgi:phosphate uptake regulator
MRRRVIKQGHNTLTITLPAKWAATSHIVAGDEVELDARDGNLVIRTGNQPAPRRVIIDITDSYEFLDRELGSLYKRGYDEIEITSETPEHLSKIPTTLKEDMIGFEITQQSKKSCIIRNVAEAQPAGFDEVLRRMLLLLGAMARGVAEALQDNDSASLPNLLYMEKTNNRYTSFLRRVLNRDGYDKHEQEKILYSFIEFSEKVADEYKYLCLYLQEHANSMRNTPKHVTQLYMDLGMLCGQTTELLFRYDKAEFKKVYLLRKRLVRESQKLLENGTSRTSVLAHYALVITQIFADMAALIMTMRQ